MLMTLFKTEERGNWVKHFQNPCFNLSSHPETVIIVIIIIVQLTSVAIFPSLVFTL